MNFPANLLRSRIAVSCARSFLACCHDTVGEASGAGMAAGGCSRNRLADASNVSQPHPRYVSSLAPRLLALRLARYDCQGN